MMRKFELTSQLMDRIGRSLAALALAGSLVVAGAQAPAQTTGTQGGEAGNALQENRYAMTVGGADVGTVTLAVTRTEGGTETHGSVTAGATALRSILITEPDGSATSYQLDGTIQGVAFSLHAEFTPTSADFELTQQGDTQRRSVPLDGPVYVLDNLLIDGFQILVEQVLAGPTPGSDGVRTFPVVVPQIAALGTFELGPAEPLAPGATTRPTVGSEAVSVLHGRMDVGPQALEVTLEVDADGLLVSVEVEPGSLRIVREDQGGAEPPSAVDSALKEAASCLVEADVTIDSTGATLAGKLTLPKAAADGSGVAAPTLLLLPGSGPVGIDGDVLPLISNHGYQQLAYALACEGYGVLRAAKLGIPPSTGDASAATLHSYAENVRDWFGFLRERPGVDPERLGLIGHSEGALIALYAAANDLASPAALVLIAGPGRPMEDLIREQVLNGYRRAGSNPATMRKANAQVAELIEAIRASTGERLQLTPELSKNPLVAPFASGAGLLRSELGVSPSALAREVTAPVAVFQGEKDLQVSALDATLLAAAAPHPSLHLLPDLGHNLVATSGPAEAAALPGPDALIDPELVAAMLEFLHGNLPLNQ